jgi:hypothetical protein
MTADRTVTHLEGTDFQKSRAFSPAVVTQGGKIVWLAGQTALSLEHIGGVVRPKVAPELRGLRFGRHAG